jgi:ribonuclease BN (tRNA processing enzyme)
MRILVLGIGDAFTALHFGSSALLEVPNPPAGVRRILIDCPDLVHRVLREASIGHGPPITPADVDAIILTHLHGDHCNGLESFAFARRILRLHDETIPVPRLYCAPPVADRLWERLAPAMDAPFGGAPSHLADYFDVRTIEPGSTHDVEGLRVECRYTQHSVPTIGLMIGDGEVTLGWSGDTPWEQAHMDWLDGADLIVHEANHGPAHTPIERLNALPDALRRRMRLIHLPDDFQPSCTDIPALREGEWIELPVRV